MTVKHASVVVVVFALLLACASAHAGVAAVDLCKDKKYKASGKNTFELLKAFGKNKKKKNVAKLGSDLSKAASKLSKSYTKAEFDGSGNPKGCATTNDVASLEGMSGRHVGGVVTALEGVACSTVCCYEESFAPAETSCVEYTGSAAQVGAFVGTCLGPSVPGGPGGWAHIPVPGPCVGPSPVWGNPCIPALNLVIVPPDSNCP
jgi:hypothetical protein